IPPHTGHTRLLGGAANSTAQPQNILLRVASCTWISMPMIGRATMLLIADSEYGHMIENASYGRQRRPARRRRLQVEQRGCSSCVDQNGGAVDAAGLERAERLVCGTQVESLHARLNRNVCCELQQLLAVAPSRIGDAANTTFVIEELVVVNRRNLRHVNSGQRHRPASLQDS